MAIYGCILKYVHNVRLTYLPRQYYQKATMSELPYFVKQQNKNCIPNHIVADP